MYEACRVHLKKAFEMNKLFAAIALFCVSTSGAQMKEGHVVYERTFQLPARIFANNPELADRLPRSRTDQFELLFGNSKCLWQYLPDMNAEGDGNTVAGGGMVFRFAGGANGVSYCDLASGRRVDQRDIANRSFVVTDSLTKLDWKLSEETKTILNYTTHKATASRFTTRNQMIMENGEMKRQEVPDTLTIVAWFTTDIPVAAGPGVYQGQLPGLILALEENNGQTVYQAVEVSPRVSLNKIKEPKDGKKVTAAEFTKERDKIMEEMRRNMPNGMQMRIQN